MKAFLRPAGKSGLSRLTIVYKNIFISTKVKIPPDSWDQDKQRVLPTFRHYEKMNKELTKRKAQVIKALEYLDVNDIELTKENLHQYLQGNRLSKREKVFTVSDLLKRYALDHEKTKQKGYLRKYRSIAKGVNKCMPGVLASEFGTPEMNQLIDHLIDEDKEDNTIHDYVRKIRRVMDYYSRDVKVHPDYRDFRYKYINPKPFWLDWEKVELLASLESNVYLEEFLFRCYTGLRWSDCHQLKDENIIRKGGEVYIDFTVIKTKMDQNLRLSSDAIKILKGWKWKVPKLYAHECNAEIKQICRPHFKTMIQKVRFSGQQRKVTMIPEWKMVTTHVARRTFGRRWMDLGGDMDKLRMYFGQSSIEQTARYVGYHAKEVNDELKRLMG